MCNEVNLQKWYGVVSRREQLKILKFNSKNITVQLSIIEHS